MADSHPEPRIAAWNRLVDWPLTLLAVAFLGAYTWDVLGTSLADGTRQEFDDVLWVVWALFGLDFLVRIYLANHKWWFVGTHVHDLLILLLPMFRPLRALRLLTVVTVLNRQLRADVRGKVVIYVIGAVVLISYVASLAVLDAERDAPNATITTFGDAVWWTMTTVSTVGYGDRFPVTLEGRLIAGTLMVTGIALLGVVTASIAAWFVQTVQQAERRVGAEIEESGERTSAQLDEVLAELRTVTTRLNQLEDRLGGRVGSPAGPGSTGRVGHSDVELTEPG